jgi:amidase
VRLPEYDRLDAVALAALVARGEVTALELLEAALERADARNPRLNAVVTRFDEEARARARGPLPPGPLSGVPFLLKDLLATWKGHPYTASSRLLDGWIAPESSEMVTRLERAGLVLFGQTNAAEMGILGTTEPALRGPTRNPWDLGRSAGGSSGGSAAAVAARIVPAAHGNDGGGSLRIPASACGIFGLKPTRGRVSNAPWRGEVFCGLAIEGAMTRSVRDSAALLDAISGPAPGDPYAAPPPPRPFAAEVGAPSGTLRIAVTPAPFFARATAPECKEAVYATARLLASLGHEVEEAEPEIAREALVHAYVVALAATTAADVDQAARLAGRRPCVDDLEPETWALAAGGRALAAADLVLAQQETYRAARAMAAFFETHDLLVTATMAQPPLPLGAVALRPMERLALRAVAGTGSRRLLERLFAEMSARSFDATGTTMLFNQTGQPAMSVPLHWTAGGLPVGVQFVARPGDEAALLRLAAELERARPWAERAPAWIAEARAPGLGEPHGGRPPGAATPLW